MMRVSDMCECCRPTTTTTTMTTRPLEGGCVASALEGAEEEAALGEGLLAAHGADKADEMLPVNPTGDAIDHGGELAHRPGERIGHGRQRCAAKKERPREKKKRGEHVYADVTSSGCV
jgi:hypothetical protein